MTQTKGPPATTGSVTLKTHAGRVFRVEDLGPATARLYLAGPMTGLPALNYPAFHARAAILRRLGYEVTSPAEGDDLDRPRPWAEWMVRSLLLMLGTGCSAVAVLPGWEDSDGAQMEVWVARRLSWPVLCAITLEPRLDCPTAAQPITGRNHSDLLDHLAAAILGEDRSVSEVVGSAILNARQGDRGGPFARQLIDALSDRIRREP